MTGDLRFAVRYMAHVSLCEWRELEKGGSLARYYLRLDKGYTLRLAAIAIFSEGDSCARKFALVRPSEALRDQLTPVANMAGVWDVGVPYALDIASRHVEEIYAAHEQAVRQNQQESKPPVQQSQQEPKPPVQQSQQEPKPPVLQAPEPTPNARALVLAIRLRRQLTDEDALADHAREIVLDLTDRVLLEADAMQRRTRAQAAKQ